MATTPPPSMLRMPPTPRHGAGYDQYEPYSTRHSARLASQRASRDTRSTPPPPPPSFPSSQAYPRPKRTRKQNDELESLSPPRSISGSPRKLTSDPGSDFTTAHSLRGPTRTSGLDKSDPFHTAELSASHRYRHPSRAIMTEGMLPTPAKTPRKKAVGDAGSTARTLFPQHPAPSSMRSKKGKKHAGFSLDSFSEDNIQDGSQIQIYTDSRDRIPERDESEENPFNKKPVKSSSHLRTSRRRESRMDRDEDVNESVKRRDGMAYVFRGKKMFRKFNDTLNSDREDDDTDDDLGLLSARPDLIDPSSPSVRPLTRSSIKPRVLFPSANDRARREEPAEDSDEEAATDIEGQAFASEVADDLDNADVELHQRPITPEANHGSEPPSSPGATIRSLRPRTKREDLAQSQTPTICETKKRASPFDGWLRKKQTPAGAAAKPKKRDAEAANSPGGPATKKTRGNRAAAS